MEERISCDLTLWLAQFGADGLLVALVLGVSLRLARRDRERRPSAPVGDRGNDP